MTTIQQTLVTGKTVLKNKSDSAAVDAEVLLSHCLQQPRAYLYTYPEKELTEKQQHCYTDNLNRRQQGEPVAYITGTCEFWSLIFNVTPATLIPRPETECLIDWILEKLPKNEPQTIVDLGTGSGAIAIALATERPHWTIHATDISKDALAVAKQNVQQHQCANIHFSHGNWCDALPPQDYDAIISNPPYIVNNDPHLNDLRYEPISALTSGENGLDAIQTITQAAHSFLKPQGLLAIEHGYDQAKTVYNCFEKNGYINIELHYDLAKQPRFTTARFNKKNDMAL